MNDIKLTKGAIILIVITCLANLVNLGATLRTYGWATVFGSKSEFQQQQIQNLKQQQLETAKTLDSLSKAFEIAIYHERD